jgi:ubiquinone/menaquinone biosynthesis C-methylase UbiE
MAEISVVNQDAGDFMARSVAEEKQTVRLNQEFYDAQSPVFQTITNQVCDCCYIGTSWTTRNEADVMIEHLRLLASHDLLDIGAGAGWPGLYLALQTGCAVTLLDLPETGLRLAQARAEADGMTSQLSTVQGDAADMPFSSESFTAISHSDVLCCLEDKLTVLQECRRVITADGRMCFTVIRLADGLKGTSMDRAVQAGPEFIRSEAHFPSMLQSAGWQIIRQDDITGAFLASTERMIAAEEKQSESLRALRGDESNETVQENLRSRLHAVADRLILREFFSVVPA